MSELPVSVIVPVYNAGGYLSQCVESILGQTQKNIEIILVDDGSTDGSGKALDAYAGRDPRVRVIHKENGGLVSAWSTGAEASRGDYLCFVDSDDWIDASMITDFLVHASEEGSPFRESEIIAGGFLIERGSGSPQRKMSAAQPGEYTGERLLTCIKEKILGYENRTMILSRCMKLISRNLILKNIRSVDKSIRMGEDLNIMVPAVLDAQRVVLLDEAPYHYRFVGDSMVHGYDTGMYDNIVRLRERLEAAVRERKITGGLGMVRAEFMFLMLLELKNEIRRRDVPAGKARNSFAAAVRGSGMRELLSSYGDRISAPADRLLAFAAKEPSGLRFYLVRFLFLHH